MSRTLASLLVALGALFLTACGFHLRGAADLPPNISPLTISGLPVQDSMRRELEQLIGGNGAVAVQEGAEGARSVLRILKREPKKRVLSVDNRGKVVEYEISETVEFDLTEPGGKLLVERQKVSMVRAYTNTEQEQVLGKQQEEELIRDDIRRDLAAQVVRRLQAKLRP